MDWIIFVECADKCCRSFRWYFRLCAILTVSLLGEEASPSIGNTLRRVWTMFTRSAITPPEVNGFGWNLRNSRVYCLELALTDFGRDPRRTESGRACGNFVFCQVNNARLCRFPVSQISRNLHTRRGSETWWILSEQICENLPVRGLFSKKTSKCRWLSSTTSQFRPRFLRND